MAQQDRFPSSLGGFRSFDSGTAQTQPQAPDIFAPRQQSAAPAVEPFVPVTNLERLNEMSAIGRGEGELPGGGLASTEPGALDHFPAPVVTGGTFAGVPGGDQTPIPPLSETLQDGKPKPGALSQTERDTINALGGGSEAERLVREAKQQTTIRESGSTSAGRKLAESLKEQGLSEEDINKAVEGSATNFERFQKLNQLQKRETSKRSASTKLQGARDRLAQGEHRDEDGGAKDRKAIAVDVDNFFQGFGVDTDSETQMIDHLNKSQQREVERFLVDSSHNSATEGQRKRMKQFQDEATTKDERAFRKKKNDATQAKLEDAAKKAAGEAETKAEKNRIDGLTRERDALGKDLKRLLEKRTPSEDEQKRIDKIEARLVDLVDEFSPGLSSQQQSQDQVSDSKPFMDLSEKDKKSIIDRVNIELPNATPQQKKQRAIELAGGE